MWERTYGQAHQAGQRAGEGHTDNRSHADRGTGLVWPGAGQGVEIRLHARLGVRSRGQSTRLGEVDVILEAMRSLPESLSRD